MTRWQILSGRLVLLLVSAAGITCSGGDPMRPGPEPAQLAMAGGNGQSGPAGQPLPNPIGVLVTDDAGDPVAGVTVGWSVTGGGSVSPESVASGDDGRAMVAWTLGPTVGSQTATATVDGLSGSPVRFSATATGTGPPGDPAKLLVIGQPSSTAQSGQVFPDQPVVQVTDAEGDPVAAAGRAVTAALAAGSGTLGGTLTVETDGAGKAAFTGLSLTAAAGTYAIRFTSPGLAATVSGDIALSTAAGSATLTVTVQPPASALTAEVFSPPQQPAVKLVDQAGAPMAGAAVTATVVSGGGTLQGETTATTSTDGVAAFGDLGIEGSGAQTLGFSAAGATATSSTVTLTPLPPEAATGTWDAPVSWAIVPLHMNLLPGGKILAWGRNEENGSMGQPRLWDPTGGSPLAAITVANDRMLFCAGHALMPDGRLMVSGGHKLDDRGLDVTNIFDPARGSWVPGLPKMAKGRWYPTVTTLPDGRMVTVAGKDTTKAVVLVPEVWEGGAWVQLPGASLKLPYYPRDFVDPKTGLLFYAGERIVSRWLDVDGNGTGGRGKWTSGPSHIWKFNRDYGSAVMYNEGKILYVGGGGDTGWDTPDGKSAVPTATAEKIDLKAGAPSWSGAGSMASPRRHLNATVLPDGRVLVTGGVSGGGFNDIASAVRMAEVWDPATGGWSPLASNAVSRGYHAVSLLLPDGTVLHGASGDANIPGTSTAYPAQRNHEIFHPPYLYRGARPTISNAPASVGYGQTFLVATPAAAQVAAVRWIHLGTVTHAFDQSARANTLAFTRAATGVNVTAPSGPAAAPPGHYLLFILNRNGVPSTAKIVKVQ